jgi:hypothetical protein
MEASNVYGCTLRIFVVWGGNPLYEPMLTRERVATFEGLFGVKYFQSRISAAERSGSFGRNQ